MSDRCSEKLELAAWRFLAERGLKADSGRDAICKAMDLGMTWPLGCLGMPEGFRVQGA
jgi:hypothetical protein